MSLNKGNYMDNEYNLVQDCETGNWEGRRTVDLDGSTITFPATGETLDEVITTIDNRVREAGLEV